MSKILVTGGKGFVGTNLVPELESRGHEVIVCDLMHDARPNHIRCDISEYRQIEKLLQDDYFDYVYNLAAEYGRWNGEAYYENLWRTNVIGLKHLLKIQEFYKFKLIHFSSAEVYGDYPEVMTEDVMDNIVIKQMNDYAISKWVNELDIKVAQDMFGIEAVVVRPGCMYGINEYYHPYRGVIPVFIYKALQNEPYTVYEGHTRIHDYIVDSCRTYANIVDNFKAGEVYNVGGKPEWNHTIRELSDLILKVAGRSDGKVIYKPEEPFTTKHKTLDSSKAIRDLNHNPSTPLEEGIKKTVEWMANIYGRVD